MDDGTQSGSKWAKRLSIVGLVIVVLGVVGYYGFGYYVFDVLSNSPGGCRQPFMVDLQDNQPDDFGARYLATDPLIDVSQYQMSDFEDVRFTARDDNVTLAGWLIQATTESERVIIMVHGIDGCRRESTQLIPAGMLANNGFDTLVIDLRNHGDSEVTDGRMTAGYREYRDVLGAYDYLLEQGYEAENIGMMGISLGSIAATVAFELEPTIPALFLESPLSSLDDMVVDQFSREGYPLFLIPGAYQVAQAQGINLNERSPNTSIVQHEDRPIYIIHGDADTRIPVEQAIALHALAGNNATLDIRPNLNHVEAIYDEQDYYEATITEFFNTALGN